MTAAALFALLAIASLSLGRALGSGPRLRLALVASAAAIAFGAAARDFPGPPGIELDDAPLVTDHGGYVGSGACASCHPSQFASWTASYHRRMTQEANADTVVAPFDGTVLEGAGRRYRLLEEDGVFWVDMQDPDLRGPDAPQVRRRIVMTTGSHHEQDYWYEVGPGRAVAHFPFVYRIAEKRWVPNGSTFVAPPPAGDAPPRPEHGGWNRNCIQCHATGAVPAFVDGDVRTRVAELGIACEACHGEGAEHVRANQDPLRRYALHAAAGTGDDAGAADPTIVNPRRLDHERASEVCGQCHLVSTVLGPGSDPEWNSKGFAFRPGDRLADTREVILPGSAPDDPALARMTEGNSDFLRDRFWSDGMIRVSGREYHGLAESPCFRGGEMSCTTCHRMHPADTDPDTLAEWADDQLAPMARGNGVCASCHPDLAANAAVHSHHAPGTPGTLCYECHMPHTTYGLLKGMRSHQVTSPSVAASLATGRPDACNLCHLDRSLGWTAERLKEWYGIDSPPLDADRREVAASILWVLEGDAGLRALAAWHLGRPEARRTSRADGEGSWAEPWLERLLDDPYDAVRFVAENSWRTLPGNADAEYDFVVRPETRAPFRSPADLDAARVDVSRLDDPAALLLDETGALDRIRTETIAARRDDRPVELRE